MYRINEEATYESLYSNEDIIEKLGEIDVYDSEKKEFVKMNAGDIIKVSSDALYKLQRDYNYLYQFITKCKLMYIPTFPSQITDTMAVDNNSNLWMNMTFIYDTCKMNSDRVFGILFHELFHIFFDHLLRFEKIYPKSMYASAGPGVYKKANMKANICMDYEVNASMVDDGIVTADFFKVMNGLYKKEYTGMTWEEILDEFGDKEYNEWLTNNGMSLDDVEKKILDAIEEASKTLLDPDSDDKDKRAARKKLQKTLDELLGKKDRNGEKTIQDVVEELEDTKLADHGEIGLDLDDLADDLSMDPEDMSDDDFNKTMSDIDKLMTDIEDNADEIGSEFGKTGDEMYQDAEKAKEAMKEAIKKMKEGKLTKEEKKDLLDKAKDSLEDIISDEIEKKKLAEKRKERDEKKAAERLEKLKKTHPFRKFIIVMKNLADLRDISLISDKTYDILNQCMDDLEPLTEKKLDEIKKKDLKDISDHLDSLKESFLPDLVRLIENETILQKTEEDMQHILDTTFEHVFNAFRRIFDTTIDYDAKASLIKMAAQKLRIIGKVLKTQKKWRVSDEFKDAYISEMKRLMKLRKEEGDEALFKELFNEGLINPMYLDEHGMELLDKLMGSGEIDKDDLEGSEIPDMGELSKHLGKPIRYSDDMDYDEEEWKPYEGTIYYNVWVNEDGEASIELSDRPNILPDDAETYGPLGLKFEKDFPEYRIAELMEAVFEVCYVDTYDFVNPDELRKKLEDNPDYEQGRW